MADRRAFDDWLTGSEASDAIFGADGNDTIDAVGGDDAPAGGAGDDAVDGGSGFDSMPTTPSPCTTASRHPQSDDDRPFPRGRWPATGPTPSIHLRSWRRPRSGGWAWSERSELEPGSPHTVLHSIA